MKKLITSLAIISLSSVCFGEPNLVYCPERITCSEDGNINSCKPSDSIESWSPQIRLIGGEKVQSGDYVFWIATGFDARFLNATCTYVHSSSRKSGIELVTNKFRPYIIYNPAPGNENGWSGEHQVSCFTNRLVCPFQAN